MASEEKRASVYVSWLTFKNSIERLAGGLLPNRIDRTVFPGMAGGVQVQLLAGLRFLGLIDTKGHPTDELRLLAVPNESDRRVALKGILEERYADLFALDLTKATPAQVEEQMTASYGASGETRAKGKRFFLAAIDYVGIEVSPLLRQVASKKNHNGKQPKRRRSPRRRSVTGDAAQPAASATGSSRIIKLRSGGTLTVSASLDLFSLGASDRAFVFNLIDRLEEYERENASAGGTKADAEEG